MLRSASKLHEPLLRSGVPCDLIVLRPEHLFGRLCFSHALQLSVSYFARSSSCPVTRRPYLGCFGKGASQRRTLTPNIDIFFCTMLCGSSNMWKTAAVVHKCTCQGNVALHTASKPNVFSARVHSFADVKPCPGRAVCGCRQRHTFHTSHCQNTSYSA